MRAPALFPIFILHLVVPSKAAYGTNSPHQVCWGYNGPNDQLSFIPGLPVFAGLALGGDHVCGWEASGKIWCWGTNDRGQTIDQDPELAIQVAAGDKHNCAVRPDGTLWCWGGTGFSWEVNPGNLPPDIVGLTSGDQHNCVWTRTGAAACWGSNSNGKATVPVGLAPVSSMDVSEHHTCALLQSGSIRCWGGSDGLASIVPAAITNNAVQLATTSDWTCTIYGVSRSIVCWGGGPYASLYADWPAKSAGTGWDGIAASEYSFCAWRLSGDISCWGDPIFGQLDVPHAAIGAPLLKVAGSIERDFFCALIGTTSTTTTVVQIKGSTAWAVTATAVQAVTTTPVSTVSSTMLAAISSTETFTPAWSPSGSVTSTTTSARLPENPADLLALVPADEEQTVVDRARTGYTASNPAFLELPLAKLAAFLIGPLGPSPAALVLLFLVAALSGSTSWRAGVVIPAAVVRSKSLEGSVCVVSALASHAVMAIDGKKNSDGSPVSIFGAVTIRLFNAAGARQRLSNLAEPVLVDLPTVHVANMVCAFWNETEQYWSTEGVSTLSNIGDFLRCATNHLTLFAGVVAGFADTIRCTNVQFFSEEGIANLLDTTFLQYPVVIAFEAIVALLLLVFLAACLVDLRRGQQDVWKEEKFLIPAQHCAEILCKGASQTSSLGTDVHLSPTTSSSSLPAMAKTSTLRKAQVVTQRSLVRFVDWAKQSSAMRDALDDIASRWFLYFSEVRDFIENTCAGMSMSRHGSEERPGASWQERVAVALLGSLITSFARRQAAASAGLSAQSVEFFLEDKDLRRLLLEVAITPEEDGLPQWKQRLKRWLVRHDSLIQQIDKHWNLPANWRALPRSAARLFLMCNPFVAVFLDCEFRKCHLRVIFLAADLLGSLMIATAFFSGSGMMTGKRSRGECASPRNPGEQIGRLIAIGVVAMLVAYIPVYVMYSLHSRSIKMVDGEGGPQWRRQVRLWHTQDKILLVVGSLYNGFCTFYVFVFLANVNPRELPKWAVTGGTSLVEDCLVVPVAIALLVPFTSMGALSLGSLLGKLDRHELLTQRRREQEAKGWYPMITEI